MNRASKPQSHFKIRQQQFNDSYHLALRDCILVKLTERKQAPSNTSSPCQMMSSDYLEKVVYLTKMRTTSQSTPALTSCEALVMLIPYYEETKKNFKHFRSRSHSR